MAPPRPEPAPQPAPPDLRRDPFAAQPPPAAAQPAYQGIVDAGPPLEIPEEKKSYTKLIILLVITALIPLLLGWACGRIYGARVLFNRGIDSANQIKSEVAKIAKVNKSLAIALAQSRVRNKNKILFDKELLEELKAIMVKNSTVANPERARKMQEKLFKNDYSMMDDIVIDRLFNYYNNTIRLYYTIEQFDKKVNAAGDLLQKYSEVAKMGRQKYGIVFAQDAGQYYLGALVEVGNIVCADPEAKVCPRDKVDGFMVRMNPGSAWSSRKGKAKKMTEVVIPIMPDKNWTRVTSGRPGYLEFREYVMGYRELATICALLYRDAKPLMQDLGKAGGRPKVFAPL